MEPVSTVAVASTASAASASTSTVATGVGTGATATTASTGGAVSAEASKQAEIIRRLASTLIHSGETQILNQSEIVDEFAAPIYAGISAATPSAGGGKENSQPKSLATTNGGEKIEEMPVADGKNTDVASAKGADSSIVQPEHSPEIKVLLDENYPAPTIEHLRLQHYSNLAYGAQTLQYFRCVTRSSPVYERIREMNQEIQARAYVFVGCEVVDVWHTGIDVPIGTKRLINKFLPSFVKTFSVLDDGTALVSWLRNNGREYLMVVNRDPNDDITLKAKFINGVEIVRRDGSRAKASTYSDSFWLDPGDTVIFAAP